MSAATRDILLMWIEQQERAKGNTHARLAVYASDALVDGSVPEGWVRVIVAAHAV